MTTDDVAAAERVTAIGFHELDTRMFRRSWPDPQLRPPERSAHWVRRTQHLLSTDPGGCWVAEDGSDLLGVVVSFVREKMWLLASYAVVPGAQGLGLGRALLAPALEHGRGSLRGMLNASNDPRAVRRYHEAGFADVSTDVPARQTRPVHDPGRREGARGQRERHRPDGLARPPDPWRSARRRPRDPAGAAPAGGQRHLDRTGLCLSARWHRPARGDRPAYRCTADVGGDRIQRRGA